MSEKSSDKLMCDGNEAASYVAYRATELAIIYPITPSSPMAENYEAWSDAGRLNVFGQVPEVAAMQSEAGAIGAVHGALQAGSLTTTFTASQGLLLMIPTMYKMAGELHPFVMHVSARTVAKHALSIFGDHSDVMACRQTGFAMLCANSVQEAHDFALVSHAATLEARVPFMHFFDGFRTSHEINLIDKIPDETIAAMISPDRIGEFRHRSLDPDRPSIRGTAQNPDVFFQASEAANPYYNKVEEIVSAKFAELARLTGRGYAVVEYVGAPDAERVVVCMGSACETIEETASAMDGKVGLVKVRLYRPFPVAAFAKTLPQSAKKIAVLDRTKESGGVGEPLYLDVIAALKETGRGDIGVIGGRYGLSSKEFTPPMAKAVFDELEKPAPKREFTVGINDDVTRLSLDFTNGFALDDSKMSQALFYGLGSDGTVGANKNSIKIITSEGGKYGQAYFEYDSKKSGGTTISHLRFSGAPIRAPYLVSSADFVAVHHFPLFHTLDILKNLKAGGTLLINSPFRKEALWDALPLEVQAGVIEKKLKVFAINASAVARDSGMGRRINTIMQTAFFHLANVISGEKAIASIKKAIEKTYAKKGPEIVAMNFKAVDGAIANIYKVDVPDAPSKDARPRPAIVSSGAPEVVRRLEAKIMAGQGNDLPVSAFDPSGTFPSATSKYEKRSIAEEVPVWNPADCIQCGKCALVCPHAAIRTKAAAQSDLTGAPASFKHAPYKTKELGEGLEYIVQCSPRDCTGCGLCVAGCPVKKEMDGKAAHAINMRPFHDVVDDEEKNFEFFETIPYIDRAKLNPALPKHTQLMRPLFEYSGACAGCGEAGYIRLVTQLYGDRMVVANATGCSSIYGGNLPTTPYCMDDAGRGPAWSNSLFEDNAEYGYGQAVALAKQREVCFLLLKELAPVLGDEFAGELMHAPQKSEAEIAAQRARIDALGKKLEGKKDAKSAMLRDLSGALLKKSVWIFGGDGWAYDIGYGGLDHVLNMADDVNILVLDTEVYSNTGGQQSKSTPKGASAKFATGGRALAKKDLGLIAMSGANAYVAKIALGANEAQAIKALREAESFDGPSLIIAYSPCIAHGFDLVNGPAQAKAAVDSGHWELYRFDPRRIREGQPPLQLDSAPASIDLRDYLLKETRYKALFSANPQKFGEIIKEREFENRYKRAFFDYLSKFRLEG
ncbi:MAG: pyruvate:ferredoxin (flavodoxin) oxidoreductase [Rickettsiales bacterium]|nr:pyruvate:ferredoxin (flavodoxin) oxidoreductase [Rickettsiales bacterium]